MRIGRRNFLKKATLGSFMFSVSSAKSSELPDPDESSIATSEPGVLSENMTLLFLGSGASGRTIPDLYPTDRQRLLSGQFRAYSSLLVNDSVLIDCGATVPKALEIFDVDVDVITDILITHSHGDHFNANSIRAIQSLRPDKKINLWVTQEVASARAGVYETGCEVKLINANDLTPFYVQGLNVTPVAANHHVGGTGETCLHYVLQSQNKTLLYALDGAWLTTKTWETLSKMKLDAIVWDATQGDDHDDSIHLFSHNNLPMIRLMNQNIKGCGVIDENALIIVSHMARSANRGHPPHPQLVEKLKSEGMMPAHDGLKLEL